MAIEEVRFFADARLVARLDARAAAQGMDRAGVLDELLGGDPVVLSKQQEDLMQAAMNSVQEGRLIPQQEIEAWAESLGTANPLPLPTVKNLLQR